MFGKDRICIIGSGVGWHNSLKYRFTHKIWAVYSAVQHLHGKIDLAFGADPLERLTDKKGKTESIVAMKAVVMSEVFRRKIPIFLPKEYSEHPTSVKYPLKEIVDKFGITYFSNTICYMIAYAVYKEVKSIDLFGINMSYGSEYEHEKGGLEFWLGFAMGKGLKVNIHGKESMVLKTKANSRTILRDGDLYGYSCVYNLKNGIVNP